MVKNEYFYGGVKSGRMILYVARDRKDASAWELADAYHYKLFKTRRNFGNTTIKPKLWEFQIMGKKEYSDGDGIKFKGFRFIKIPASFNPKKVQIPRDMVDDIMDYESGNMNATQEKKLFRNLKKTGIGKSLQGHYSSRM